VISDEKNNTFLQLDACIFCLSKQSSGNYFLLRDADMHSAYSTCYGNVAGWLAGWVSVTRRYCIKTAILKLFRSSGVPSF